MESEINSPLSQKTVGELVAEDYRKAEIFKKYGIDFCCGGKATVSDICKRKGIDEQGLMKDLETLMQAKDSKEHDFKSWDPAFLADYIINVHHSYVSRNTGPIREYLEKVVTVHGHANPELARIRDLFFQLADELNEHMKLEEKIVFPAVRNLSNAKLTGGTKPAPLSFPFQKLVHDHEAAGEILHTIEKETQNYNFPEYACNTWRVLYAKLKEFNDDLEKHVHLENNILFPLALEMEHQLS